MAHAAKARNSWLIKSEPDTYSWERLVKDGGTRWDGVRNFEARANLRAMRVGDLLLFYHSGSGKQMVGLARVTREAYADPTSSEDWSAVDVAPWKPLVRPVSLAQVKAERTLSDFALVRRSRLSVVPVTPKELERVLELADTRL